MGVVESGWGKAVTRLDPFSGRNVIIRGAARRTCSFFPRAPGESLREC